MSSIFDVDFIFDARPFFLQLDGTAQVTKCRFEIVLDVCVCIHCFSQDILNAKW